MSSSSSYVIHTKRAEGAAIPTRGSSGAAGYDLSAYIPGVRHIVHPYTISAAPRTIVIAPGARACISTGLMMMIPPGRYGRVAPRSGLAVKHGIDVLAGVIDSDYRGVIGVILLNTGSEPFTVNHGDRIAQLIIERCELPEMVEVASLDDTDRGPGAYGSTGAN